MLRRAVGARPSVKAAVGQRVLLPRDPRIAGLQSEASAAFEVDATLLDPVTRIADPCLDPAEGLVSLETVSVSGLYLPADAVSCLAARSPDLIDSLRQNRSGFSAHLLSEGALAYVPAAKLYDLRGQDPVPSIRPAQRSSVDARTAERRTALHGRMNEGIRLAE